MGSEPLRLVSRSDSGQVGRRPALTDDQAATARTVHAAGMDMTTVAAILGVSPSTAYRACGLVTGRNVATATA